MFCIRVSEVDEISIRVLFYVIESFKSNQYSKSRKPGFLSGLSAALKLSLFISGDSSVTILLWSGGQDRTALLWALQVIVKT
jgi:hypothetical protein